jgi:hypothetical protein
VSIGLNPKVFPGKITWLEMDLLEKVIKEGIAGDDLLLKS